MFKLTRSVIVIQFDYIFHGSVITFNLALCLWMIWFTPDMKNVLSIQVFSKVFGCSSSNEFGQKRI